MELWVWLGAILIGLGILIWAFSYLVTRVVKLMRSLTGLNQKLKELQEASLAVPEIVRPVSSLGEDPIPLIVQRLRLLGAKRERKKQQERRLIKRLLSR